MPEGDPGVDDGHGDALVAGLSGQRLAAADEVIGRHHLAPTGRRGRGRVPGGDQRIRADALHDAEVADGRDHQSGPRRVGELDPVGAGKPELVLEIVVGGAAGADPAEVAPGVVDGGRAEAARERADRAVQPAAGDPPGRAGRPNQYVELGGHPVPGLAARQREDQEAGVPRPGHVGSQASPGSS